MKPVHRAPGARRALSVSIACKQALLVFMRYPEYGKVKTRLGTQIGKDEALKLHTVLLRRTLGVARDFKHAHPGVAVFLCYTPPERAADMARSFPGPWEFVPQTGDHLGERMAQAMKWAFGLGYSEVTLVGSDIGDLHVSDLEESFVHLRNGGAVLGPALDGGFYLIGLTRFVEAPFQHAEWGTADIFRRTERLLSDAGWHIERLGARRDIDRLSDVTSVRDDPLLKTTLSVIVPTLNDPAVLWPHLEGLQRQLWPDDELIVVWGVDQGRDGPSTDEKGLKIVYSPKGRGIQLNEGVRCASGEVLLFLHDDTGLPDQFPYLVRKAALNQRMSLGCFSLRFSPSTPLLDLIARWADLRTRLFRLPYGDQALFCRRDLFQRLGGFKRRYLMEDVEFVKACRREGPLSPIDEAVMTSPNRYLEKGILLASLQNHLTMFLYCLGVEEERLYAFYYRKKSV